MSKKTKIVATIGPASEDIKTLEQMVKSGMNVARLNFSHGNHESHKKIIGSIRTLSQKLECPVGILADLQGPRIRILVDKDVEVADKEIIKISDPVSYINCEISKSGIVFLDKENIIKDINPEEMILIEDGLIRLKVVKKEEKYLEAEAVNGGIIKNHKGVNIPDSQLHFGAVTKKDEEDLEFVLGQNVDFVALSFVSNGKEIEETREKIKKILGRDYDLPQIISKIERKEAIKNIDEIISASDAIMVARGDLGIELDESKVVLYQKEIIAKCLKAMKPVIVATQMLDSMIENPIPTRAEVSDVSNAVIDHTDAVMLSGESANGKYPVKTIETMAKIIRDTEASPFDDINPGFLNDDIFSDYASIIDSAHELAKGSNAKAILMLSESGFTAKIMSHHRPDQLLLVATGNPVTYNQLSLVWGVRTYLFDKEEDLEKMIDQLIEKAKEENKLSSGDKAVVIIGRVPRGKKMKLIGIQEIE